MSAEQLKSIDITDTFTPKQKEQWQKVSPFFEDGSRMTMFSLRDGPDKPTEIFLDCLEEDFMGTVIKGTLEESLDSFRTPKQAKNNQDNHLAIAQAIIANGSAQINVKLYRS